MRLMSGKNVIRIKVSQAARQAINDWAKQQDMTQVGVTSRIYEWFGVQKPAVKRAITGQTEEALRAAFERLLAAFPGELNVDMDAIVREARLRVDKRGDGAKKRKTKGA